MMTEQDNTATWIAIVTMVAFNGNFLSANGVFMLVAPQVGTISCQA